jgi:hypothetical protein
MLLLCMINPLRAVFRVTLIFILGLSTSCQSTSRGIDAKVLNVFPDFVYVGSGQAKFLDDGSVDVMHTAPHGENEQPRPVRLERGVQYVFHDRGSVSNEQLALKELPARLSGLGLKVIESPKSSLELSYPYFGGPLFFITFSDGKNKGAIFNRLHGKLGNDSYQIADDYIIVFFR